MKNKYSTGGSLLKLLAPIAGIALPGIGTAIGAGMTTVGNLIDSEQQIKPPVPTVKTNYSTNPYAMRTGGQPNTFKQYNAASHEEGGQPIDSDGNVNYKSPSAEIETVENKYTYTMLPGKGNKTYVFSEKNGTSKIASDIVAKYKNKNINKDFLARTAMELDLEKVEKVNDLINQKRQAEEQSAQTVQSEQPQMSGGGGLNISTLRHERYHQKLSGVFDKVLMASQDRLEQLGEGGLPGIDEPNYGNTVQLGTHLDKFNSTNMPYPTLDPTIQLGNNVGGNINWQKQSDGNLPSSKFVFPKIKNINGLVGDAINIGSVINDLSKAANAKADTVNPRLVDYSKSDDKMYSTNTDLTAMQNQAQNATNQAVTQINDGSSSQAQRQSRLQGVYGNFGDTLSNIALQQQSQRNQLLTQQGQYEMSKATDNSNRMTVADDKYAMNQAATRQYNDVARQTVNSFAKDLAEKQYASDQLNHVMTQAKLKTQDGFALLNKMVDNFGLTGLQEWQKYLSNPSDENMKGLETAIKLKIKI